MYDRQRFRLSLQRHERTSGMLHDGSCASMGWMSAAYSIEACAMYAYPSPTLYAPFVYCLEGQHGWWDGEAQKGGVNESFIEPCASRQASTPCPSLHASTTRAHGEP